MTRSRYGAAPVPQIPSLDNFVERARCNTRALSIIALDPRVDPSPPDQSPPFPGDAERHEHCARQVARVRTLIELGRSNEEVAAAADGAASLLVHSFGVDPQGLEYYACLTESLVENLAERYDLLLNSCNIIILLALLLDQDGETKEPDVAENLLTMLLEVLRYKAIGSHSSTETAGAIALSHLVLAKVKGRATSLFEALTNSFDGWQAAEGATTDVRLFAANFHGALLQRHGHIDDSSSAVRVLGRWIGPVVHDNHHWILAQHLWA